MSNSVQSEGRRRTPRPKRRWPLLLVGIALIVGSLGLLGSAAWEYWGTNVVSKKHQTESRQELTQAWKSGKETTKTEFGNATAIIKIPAFGSGYAMPAFEGTTDAILGAGFGIFDSSVEPGQPGNYSITAHRVTHGEPLREMPQLKAGDEVHVVTRKTTFIYTLTSGGDELKVPFTSSWVLDKLPTNPNGGVQPAQKAGQALLTLATCAALFETDDRFVAFGILTDSVPTES